MEPHKKPGGGGNLFDALSDDAVVCIFDCLETPKDFSSATLACKRFLQVGSRAVSQLKTTSRERRRLPQEEEPLRKLMRRFPAMKAFKYSGHLSDLKSLPLHLLPAVAASCPRLEELTLEDMHLRGPCFSQGLQALTSRPHAPALHSISLEGCEVDRSVCRSIAALCPQLRHLGLSCTKVSDVDLEHIGRSCRNLLSVDLECTEYPSTQSIASLLAANPSLTSLVIGGDGLGADILVQLGRVGSTSLLSLHILQSDDWWAWEHLADLAQGCPNLRSLKLQSGISEEDELPMRLIPFAHLVKLEIDFMPGFSPPHFRALLARCPALTSLAVYHMEEVAEEDSYIGDADLRWLATSCPRLQELEISSFRDNTAIQGLGFGEGFAELQVLRLKSKALDDEGLLAIAQGLQELARVRPLVFRRTECLEHH